ncbi:MAG TPA: response regulator [Thermoanaerobaculia bacterium]
MNKGTILLVEDNADDVERMLVALEENKIANEVVLARDGVRALDDLFEEIRPLPAVVLLDLNLPKIGGLDVLRELRAAERTRLLPVVMLTSSKEERDLVDSYQLGANSYVRKPIDFVEFATAVRHLGLYWLILNQGPPTS